MRRQLFLSLLTFMVLVGFTQNRTIIPKELQDYNVKYDRTQNSSYELQQTSAPLKNTHSILEENTGITYYDLQSNGSMQNRIHIFDDGTMGAVFTYMEAPFSLKGSGYNYSNGYEWGAFPTEPLEEYHSGCPSYAPFGENGEIIVSHIQNIAVEKGLTFSKRENKGTGEWEQWILQGPEGFENIYVPHMATGGLNNSVIHVLAITHPLLSIYQGQSPALLYSRSADGGTTWNPENYIIPLINADHYLGFGRDLYNIHAEGDNVAILIGGPWLDLLLLKSTDGGDNWEKTIIWEHPYPLFETLNSYPTDTFYCVDGSHDLDFDENGKVHVTFGINRAYADSNKTYWFPAVGGIGYWNEDITTFSNDFNSLNPYGHPDSELEENYSLVGWSQDMNGNDTIDVLDDWGTYYLGFSSMPQIYVDNNNRIYIVYSSVTEGYDNNLQNYRHLWCRLSPIDGWWGQHHHLTNYLNHVFDECVFPSLAKFTDNWPEPHILYQQDDEPGMTIWGDEDPYGENFISHLNNEIWLFTAIDGIKSNSDLIEVSQNHPNPFKEKTTIQIKLKKTCDLKLEITDLTGGKVYENNLGYLSTGTHNISIKVPSLSPGIYFYSVVAGDHSVTKKMIVK